MINQNDRKVRIEGAVSKEDLTYNINNNLNVTQIVWGQANYDGWVTFQRYLAGRKDEKGEKTALNQATWNTLLESTDSNQLNSLSQQYIDDYNNRWLPEIFEKDNPNREKYIRGFQISTDNIVAIQAYTSAAPQPIKPDGNPVKIFVDGWLGSQTSRMTYPSPSIDYMSPSAELRGISDPKQLESKIKSLKNRYGSWLNHIWMPASRNNGIYRPSDENSAGYIPVIWGNVRFVIKARTLFQLMDGWEIQDDPKDITKTDPFNAMEDYNRIYNYKDPNIKWTEKAPVPRLNNLLIPTYGIYYGLEIYDPEKHFFTDHKPKESWFKGAYNPGSKEPVLKAINDYNKKVETGDNTYRLVKTTIK